MARSELNAQQVTRDGLDPVYAAANVDGNSFANGGQQVIHVKNGSAAAVTVTVVTPRQVDGLDVAEASVDIPAGEERLIGRFPPATFNQPDGQVHVDYSDVTSITVAVLEL